MMQKLLLAASRVTGFYIGLGIEAAISLIAGVLLVLLLTNAFVKKEKPKKEKSKPTETALVVSDEQTDPWVIKDDKKGKDDTVEAVPYVQKDGEKQQPIIINVYNTNGQAAGQDQAAAATAEAPAEEAAEEPVEDEEDKKGKKKSEGIKFAEITKTIGELYAELTDEQKGFFNALKEKALAKPNAFLFEARNYESVKIGKHVIVKLQIKKGVTMGEFLIESEALKEYKKNAANAKSKTKLKIRPTVVAVTDADILKAALDMVDLVHAQLFDEIN